MDAPLVSVIVPAYNARPYIGEAIESALGQTYARLEVVVVDDGSTDGTAELVRAYAARDPRVRLITQANAGVAAARNRAIRASEGVFVAPLDADDVWAPSKIEQQVWRMQMGGTRMGMVYSWWQGIDAAGRPTGVSQAWAAEGDVLGQLLVGNFIGNASVPLFRRAALDAVGYYDPSFRARDGEGCEDWDITLRVAERYDVGLAPAYHVGYRELPASMSCHGARMRRSFGYTWEGVRARIPDVPAPLYRWSCGGFLTYLASRAYHGGDSREARRWLGQAALLDPLVMSGRWFWHLSLRSLAGVAPPVAPPPPVADGQDLFVEWAPGDSLEPREGVWWRPATRARWARAGWAAAWSRQRPGPYAAPVPGAARLRRPVRLEGLRPHREVYA